VKIDRKPASVEDSALRSTVPADQLTSGSVEFMRRVVRLAGMLNGVLEPELAAAGLARAEYDILTTLLSALPDARLRPTDLARRSILTSGGTSNALRRLEKQGLVVREKNDSDARGTWVALTDDGRSLVEATAQRVTRKTSDLLRPAEQHLAEANEMLRALAAAIDGR
jgi:DNA-binding MarR family transcriptional regulator